MLKQLRRAARWLAIPVLSVLVVAAVWFAVSALASRQPELTDSDVVFCLSGRQRAELVAAAETLGLATNGTGGRVRVGGQELDPGAWRSAREADFRRSCLALNPPRPPSPPTVIQPGLTAVLGAVVGGGIAFVAARSRDRVLRGEQDARALGSSTAAFVAAVDNYVRARGAPVPGGSLNVEEVRLRRSELGAALRLIDARHAGWSEPGAALSMLRDALSEQLTVNWADKVARAEELSGHLDRLATLTSKVATDLERGRRG